MVLPVALVVVFDRGERIGGDYGVVIVVIVAFFFLFSGFHNVA